MSPYLAEFIGTAILILLGNGVVANVCLKKTKGNDAGWIVIAAGSTCTSAGLLLGLALAAEDIGVPTPELVAVRVTPWPVTAPSRIAGLAAKAGVLLESLGGRAAPYGRLRGGLRVEGAQLGRGYGVPTLAGEAAIAELRPVNPVKLDTTYSAKAAAAAFAVAGDGPTLLWATKSQAPLIQASAERLAAAPVRMRRWLELSPTQAR